MVLAAGLLLAPGAAGAELPAFDVEERCRYRAEVLSAVGPAPGAYEACLADEGRARELIAPHWGGLPPPMQATCLRPPPQLGPQSYVLLQLCVAMSLEGAGQPIPFEPILD